MRNRITVVDEDSSEKALMDAILESCMVGLETTGVAAIPTSTGATSRGLATQTHSQATVISICHADIKIGGNQRAGVDIIVLTRRGTRPLDLTIQGAPMLKGLSAMLACVASLESRGSA